MSKNISENIEYINAKTIVSKTKSSSWFGQSYNMNIYRGCSHNCIYCDSRSNCYQIENFSKVLVKKDALNIINKDLSAKRQTGIVGTGSMSDPYNPLEKELKLTKGALALLYKYGYGLSLITKSDLIVRDIKELKNIQKFAPAIIKMTITTSDDTICKKIEPNVSLSSERFKALEKMSNEGLETGILLTPVLPWITDNEKNIEDIVLMAKKTGAKFIFSGFGMTIRDGQREYFYKKLDEKFPTLKGKYEKRFGDRYSCYPGNAKKLQYVFRNMCEKNNIIYKMKDIVKNYRGKYNEQLSLF